MGSVDPLRDRSVSASPRASDAPSNTRGRAWLQAAAAFAVYVLCLAIVYAPVFFGELDLVVHDNRTFFLPAFLLEPSLWEPRLQLGFPIAADPQFQIFYPLRYLFPATVAGFHAYVFFTLLFGACFTYLYARHLTRSFAPSVFAGVVFAFSGSMAGQLTMLTVPLVCAYLPAVLLCVHRFMEDPGDRLRFVALAGVTGLALLGGHPQFFVFVMLMAGALAMTLAWRSRLPDWRPLLGAGAAVGLGALLGAVQAFPTAELLPFTVRTDASMSAQTIAYQMEWRHIIRIAFPYLYGAPEASEHLRFAYPFRETGLHTFQELHRYALLAPLLLWLPGWRGLRDQPKLRWFFLGYAAFALLYALGNQTPLWKIFQRLPLLNTFRGPARHFLELTLIGAVWSAFGLRYIFADEARSRRERLECLAAIGGTALALVLASLAWIALDPLLARKFAAAGWFDFSKNNLTLAQWLLLALTAGALSLPLAAPLLLRGSRGWRRALLLAPLALASALDLAVNQQFSRAAVTWVPAPIAKGVDGLEERYAELPADARIHVDDDPGHSLGTNLNAVIGRTSFAIYSPLAFRSFAEAILASGHTPGVLGMYGVEYVGGVVRQTPPVHDEPFSLGSCPALPLPGPALRRSVRLELPDAPSAGPAILHAAVFCPALGPDPERIVLTGTLRFATGETQPIALSAADLGPMFAACDLDARAYASPVESTPVGSVCSRSYAATLTERPGLRSVSLEANPDTAALLRLLEIRPHADSAQPPRFFRLALLEALARGEPALAIEDLRLVRLPAPMPRVYLSPRVQRVDEASAGPAVMLLASGKLPLNPEASAPETGRSIEAGAREASFVSGPGANAPELEVLLARGRLARQGADGTPGVGGEAEIIAESNTHIQIQTKSAKPALLVLNDSFYPGWRVTVNGEDRAVLRVNRLVRGVVVPAGESEIVFRYEPRSVYAGAALSLAALAVLLGLLLWRGGRLKLFA